MASRFIKTLPKIPLDLMQPTGQHNNDTSSIITGARLNGAGGAETGSSGGSGAATSSGAASSSTSGSDSKFRYY